ncbi:PREDICTED: malate dehydrogenase-like isoform X1 [Drosophila arizonae]|uniref:Malate dehydrogenase n=1 Tax=Drosophila arizonae TaxID=7263 RepID=A0ABM1PVZ6_DROAR|nr:PREDICTED: malate dehydrogenase-like isoform X1 [Drosophila arizonae]
MFGGRTKCLFLAKNYLCSHRSPIRCHLQLQRNFRVAVIGASGGIGQPLSLLMMKDHRIKDLRLHDVQGVKGVAADLSHVSAPASVRGMQGPEEIEKAVECCDVVVITAGLARKPGMTREQLFEVNGNIVMATVTAIAKKSPGAMVVIVTNPVNAIVPMAAEVLRQHKVYDPKRLFGVTTLDCVRAERFIGDYLKISPTKVKIPVIGGHAGTTILPIMSQCQPPLNASQECIESMIKRIQNGGEEIIKAKEGKGSATLSMAFAAHRFVDVLLKGLKGEKTPLECAYVESNVTDACFFATPLSFNKNGIAKNHGLPCLDKSEKEALKSAVKQLQQSIELGINHVKCKK